MAKCKSSPILEWLLSRENVHYVNPVRSYFTYTVGTEYHYVNSSCIPTEGEHVYFTIFPHSSVNDSYSIGTYCGKMTLEELKNYKNSSVHDGTNSQPIIVQDIGLKDNIIVVDYLKFIQDPSEEFNITDGITNHCSYIFI